LNSFPGAAGTADANKYYKIKIAGIKNPSKIG
jgi:hypothetical protein